MDLGALEVIIKGARMSKAGAILFEVKGSAKYVDTLGEELRVKLVKALV